MALRQVLKTGKQLLAPAQNFGQWYLATAKKHPFPTAFFTSGIKTSAADVIAQKVSSTARYIVASFAVWSWPVVSLTSSGSQPYCKWVFADS